jgi:hypothetical protein
MASFDDCFRGYLLIDSLEWADGSERNDLGTCIKE